MLTGDFAEKLPNFQMMEIIQYIITSLPTLNQDYDGKTKDLRFSIINIRFKKTNLRSIFLVMQI
jgi:hypothetical protein